MEYRNPQYNASGTIDMEINHPQFGWIPFTASPDDVEEHSRDLFAAAQATAAAYTPDLEQVKAQVSAQIDALRDQKIAAGMPFSFPDGLGTVQLRKESDFRNVQGVASSGQALVVAGDTTTLLDFRDAENVTHPLTGLQAVQMGLSVSGFISARYKAAWVHKDAIAALTTAQAVQDYDYTANWPT